MKCFIGQRVWVNECRDFDDCFEFESPKLGTISSFNYSDDTQVLIDDEFWVFSDEIFNTKEECLADVEKMVLRYIHNQEDKITQVKKEYSQWKLSNLK